MCFVSDPSTVGAGARTRLKSRTQKFTPHCVCRPHHCRCPGKCPFAGGSRTLRSPSRAVPFVLLQEPCPSLSPGCFTPCPCLYNNARQGTRPAAIAMLMSAVPFASTVGVRGTRSIYLTHTTHRQARCTPKSLTSSHCYGPLSCPTINHTGGTRF